jgi:transcriptional regulator with PAS, ATPase and Fis domain
MSREQSVLAVHNSYRLEVLGNANGARCLAGHADLTEERSIIGHSPSIRRCAELAKRAAVSRSTVILHGESGTGKEVFARAIHRWSERRDRPFVAINCAGLSKELLESELFGYEKGAFTGAHQLKRGKLEVANGGTVLLDEIGEISIDLQAKLLRFLQEREFDRVGGIRPVRVDVRIIAATNRDLRALVCAGSFRDDLYHRLNVVSIGLPPLRERREDIRELAHYFLERCSGEAGREALQLSDHAMEKLLAYDWPGNVRELANVIERAVVLGRGPIVDVADLPARIIHRQPACRDESLSYREAVNDFRRALVIEALAKSGGSQAAAARALGLHRKYLQRLIKALRIT